jgi:hypothetical protein
VAGPHVAPLAPRAAQAHVESCTADPVRGRAVQRAGDEDEHRDDHHAVVDQRLVEQPTRRRGDEHPGHPREQDECENRLLPRFDVLRGLAPQCGEDRARRLEDRERPQPPLTIPRGLVYRLVPRRVHARRLTRYGNCTPSPPMLETTTAKKNNATTI